MTADKEKERTDDEDEDERIRMKGSGVRLIRALVHSEQKKIPAGNLYPIHPLSRHLVFFFIFLIVAQFALLSKYRALCSGWAQLLLTCDRNRWHNLITRLQPALSLSLLACIASPASLSPFNPPSLISLLVRDRLQP